jgi:hypothetical protein
MRVAAENIFFMQLGFFAPATNTLISATPP